MAALYQAKSAKNGHTRVQQYSSDRYGYWYYDISRDLLQHPNKFPLNMRFLVIHSTYVRFGRLRVRRDGKIHELEATDQVDRAEGEQYT